MSTTLLLIIIGLLIIIFTQRYLEKYYEDNNDNYYAELKIKVLKNNDLPIIWVYVPHEYNARHWCSFGSRSSWDVNQPYLNLTIKSIIKHCDSNFKICLIDDDSFDKLLPNWKINLSYVGEPVAGYLRQLGILKLVYNYGGMVVPISFLCKKNLLPLYQLGTANNNMFVCENIDRNVTSVHFDYYPDIRFMGSNRPKNPILGELIEFIERKVSADYTAQFEFLGEINRWCNKRINNNRMNLIQGTMIGIKTIDNDPVVIEDLLGTYEIKLDRNMYGIFIPAEMIINRRHYEWFARSSQAQVLSGNFILAKYFIESLGDVNIETFENKPDWVSFWRVPLRAPVWGLKPKYLGNYVPKEKYP